MTTGSTISGSAEVGLIVWTPVPAMLNVIESTPARVLARLIASRSDVWPSWAITSATVVTISEGASTNTMAALNSLVSFVVKLVAVAVIAGPKEVMFAKLAVNDALPPASVIMFVKPRKVAAFAEAGRIGRWAGE